MPSQYGRSGEIYVSLFSDGTQVLGLQMLLEFSLIWRQQSCGLQLKQHAKIQQFIYMECRRERGQEIMIALPCVIGNSGKTTLDRKATLVVYTNNKAKERNSVLHFCTPECLPKRLTKTV